MIYRAIFLFIKKYLWSNFIRGRLRSKFWTIIALIPVVFIGGALIASQIYRLTFVQGLWLMWSYVDEWAGELPRLLFNLL